MPAAGGLHGALTLIAQPSEPPSNKLNSEIDTSVTGPQGTASSLAANTLASCEPSIWSPQTLYEQALIQPELVSTENAPVASKRIAPSAHAGAPPSA